MPAPVKAFIVGTLLATLASIGCSSYGVVRVEQPVKPPFRNALVEEAEVCVLRSHNLAAAIDVFGLMFTVVRDNGTLVGATAKATYFCYDAAPGKHVIVSDGTYGASTTTLDAVSGHRYYLEQAWLWPGPRGHALSWLDAATAMSEIDADDYAAISRVPAGEPLPIVPVFAPAAR